MMNILFIEFAKNQNKHILTIKLNGNYSQCQKHRLSHTFYATRHILCFKKLITLLVTLRASGF